MAEKEINEQQEELDIEALQELANDTSLNNLVPQMNMAPATIIPPDPEEQKNIITDEMILGIYNETTTMVRQNNVEIDMLRSKFEDMLDNDGDASTSTKEAIVNLTKIKCDQADKISKIADLMTRMKLKERDTFPRYLTAHQNNTINIDAKRTPLTSAEKRALIEKENKKIEGR